MLDEHIFPLIQQCCVTDEELLATERAVAAGKEGAPGRLEAAKNKHQVAVAPRETAVKNYLSIDD